MACEGAKQWLGDVEKGLLDWQKVELPWGI